MSLKTHRDKKRATDQHLHHRSEMQLRHLRLDFHRGLMANLHVYRIERVALFDLRLGLF